MANKVDASAMSAAADTEKYFEQITEINRQYRNIVDKLTALRKAKVKSGATEVLDLLTARNDLKKKFIAKKKATKANVELLKTKNEGMAALKDRTLKELQGDFRAIDSEFMELGMLQERGELFEGVRSEDDPSRMTNTELLNKAKGVQEDNTSKLRDALQTVEMTKVVAAETAGRLQEDQEKIQRTMIGLDEVESELAISQKLITNFVKRLYTDKVIIAFTFLILCGVVGIIVYATLNPNQSLFNVPEAAKPPTNLLTSASNTPTSTHTP